MACFEPSIHPNLYLLQMLTLQRDNEVNTIRLFASTNYKFLKELHIEKSVGS